MPSAPAAASDVPSTTDGPSTRRPTPTWRKARAQAAAKSAPKASRGGDAILRVNTYDAVYAHVTVAGQSIDVPGTDKFKLAAGTYNVKLVNKYLKITRTCPVKLESGKVRTLRVSIEEGGCEVY